MLQSLINQALKDKQEERGKRERSNLFSPHLLGRCFRCQVCNRADIPQSNPPDERTLRIFKCGSLFHDFVQGFLPKHQIEVPCETEDFKGYADIVTEDTVYDIKSQHSGAFHYMEKSDYDINVKKFPNILQVMTYAWILGKPKGRLVFISKDDLCIAEHGFFIDKWLPKIQVELDELRWHWANHYTQQVLPSATPRAYQDSKGKFNEGKYCSWRDYCKGVEIGHSQDIGNHPCHSSKKK